MYTAIYSHINNSVSNRLYSDTPQCPRGIEIGDQTCHTQGSALKSLMSCLCSREVKINGKTLIGDVSFVETWSANGKILKKETYTMCRILAVLGLSIS